jgi:ClpP class serine protease
MNEKMGVRPTYIVYGENKAALNSDNPLSPEAREQLQSRVNEAGETFVRAVAKHRGVSPAVVKHSFGGGRMFSAKEAVARGMADSVGTLDQVVGGLVSERTERRARIGRQRAELAALARKLERDAARDALMAAAMQPTPKAPAVSTAPRTKQEVRAALAKLHAEHPELRKPFQHDYR